MQSVDSLGDDPPEHELKLAFAAPRVSVVLSWLEARCLADPKYPDGVINSIYYDDRDFRLLHEKIQSDFVKTKVRVRWYADPATETPMDPAFVELKRKVGGRRFKARIPIDVPAATLAEPAPPMATLRALLMPLREAGHWTPANLQPLMKIRFRRRRFVDPTTGSRISVDSDINVRTANPAFLPHGNAPTLARGVVEVKGPHAALPRWLAPLRDIGCRRESFSKYALCHEKMTRRSPF